MKMDKTTDLNKQIKKNYFFRSKNEKIIAGVFSGFGYKFNLNPWILRIIFIFMSFLLDGKIGFFIFLIYILFWYILPLEHLPPKPQFKVKLLTGKNEKIVGIILKQKELNKNKLETIQYLIKIGYKEKDFNSILNQYYNK